MTKPTVFVLAVAAAFLSSCSKETNPSPKSVNTYYFTNIKPESPKSNLTLFIDGVEKGTLPTISESPDPNSATQKATALYAPVSMGTTHVVEARDENGKVVTSSKISFTKCKTELSSNNPGTDDNYHSSCEMRSNENRETYMVEMH